MSCIEEVMAPMDRILDIASHAEGIVDCENCPYDGVLCLEEEGMLCYTIKDIMDYDEALAVGRQ